VRASLARHIAAACSSSYPRRIITEEDTGALSLGGHPRPVNRDTREGVRELLLAVGTAFRLWDLFPSLRNLCSALLGTYIHDSDPYRNLPYIVTHISPGIAIVSIVCCSCYLLGILNNCRLIFLQGSHGCGDPRQA
jgi:hypothetical protein